MLRFCWALWRRELALAITWLCDGHGAGLLRNLVSVPRYNLHQVLPEGQGRVRSRMLSPNINDKPFATKKGSRRDARNIIDTRWAIRWKMKERVRAIKVRITMRGFKDRSGFNCTHAGTASIWTQRLINSLCCEHDGFILFM